MVPWGNAPAWPVMVGGAGTKNREHIHITNYVGHVLVSGHVLVCTTAPWDATWSSCALKRHFKHNRINHFNRFIDSICGCVSKWGARDGKFAAGVCFAGLFRGMFWGVLGTVILLPTDKIQGSVSWSVSKVCFGVWFAKVQLPTTIWSWSPKKIQTHINRQFYEAPAFFFPLSSRERKWQRTRTLALSTWCLLHLLRSWYWRWGDRCVQDDKDPFSLDLFGVYAAVFLWQILRRETLESSVFEVLGQYQKNSYSVFWGCLWRSHVDKRDCYLAALPAALWASERSASKHCKSRCNHTTCDNKTLCFAGEGT